MSLTIHEEPALVYTLTLTADLNPAYHSYMDRLHSILEKYKTNGDYLSQRIFKWGLKTLSVYSPEEFGSEEQLLQKAQQRIDKLVQRILIDPLDNQPLVVNAQGEMPLLVGDWVWQAGKLAEYKALAPIQRQFDGKPPMNYDGKPFPAVPKVHELARDMILWVQSLPHRPASAAESARPQGQTSVDPFFIWDQYRTLMYLAVQTREACAWRKKMVRGKCSG